MKNIKVEKKMKERKNGSVHDHWKLGVSSHVY